MNTVAVFRSRPRRESRISIDGFAANSARISESCTKCQRCSIVNRSLMRRTLSRLPTSLAYSSSTACSVGLSSGSFSFACRLDSSDESMVRECRVWTECLRTCVLVCFVIVTLKCSQPRVPATRQQAPALEERTLHGPHPAAPASQARDLELSQTSCKYTQPLTPT